jgi:hypothetical protein
VPTEPWSARRRLLVRQPCDRRLKPRPLIDQFRLPLTGRGFGSDDVGAGRTDPIERNVRPLRELLQDLPRSDSDQSLAVVGATWMAGGTQRPSSAVGSGPYSRMITRKGPDAEGSQFATLSGPGFAFCRYRSSEPSGL